MMRATSEDGETLSFEKSRIGIAFAYPQHKSLNQVDQPSYLGNREEAPFLGSGYRNSNTSVRRWDCGKDTALKQVAPLLR